MHREQQILEDAVQAFAAEVDVKAKLVDVQRTVRDGRIDGILKITRKKHEAQFLVEVKPTITKTTAGNMVLQLKAHHIDKPFLLMAEYITPELADTLRTLGIQFLDAQGNAHVNTDWLYVFIRGRKRARIEEPVPGADIFGWAGVKVTFALLCTEQLRNAPYRAIADATGVALGTVATVMRELKRKGYIRQAADGTIRLRNARELLDRWVTAYAEKLRGKQLIGRYATTETPDGKKLQTLGALLGGETAAHQQQQYLNPGIDTVYVDGDERKIIARLGLRKDPKGKLELRRKFWNFDYPEHAQGVTPPLLTYADLLAVADPRTIEAARMLYDEYLDRYFRET